MIAALLSWHANSAEVASTAQQEPGITASAGLDEIVVQAQRRDQNLQEVPVSIVALSAQALEGAGIRSTADLGVLTPGLNIGSEQGFVQPHLRGIGTTALNPGIENPVALYVDGVYYSSVAGAIFSLNNVEHVEVDRGPQGTLFGRNATGGIIQISTRDPSQELNGNFGLTYGNYATGAVNAYVSGGIAPTLAANVAAQVQVQGTGYGINYFNGKDVNKTNDISLRSKWNLAVTDSTDLKLVLDYEETHFSPATPPAPGTTPLGGPPYTGSLQGLDGYYQPYGLTRQGGASVQLQESFDFWDFTSITAYRQIAFRSVFDGALTTDYDYALNIDVTERVWQATQDFKLSAHPDSSLQWVVGAYWFSADARYDPLSVYGGLLAPLSVDLTTTHQDTYSLSAYAQVTVPLGAQTNLTLGLRDTYERRVFGGINVIGTASSGSDVMTKDEARLLTQRPTWRVAFDYRFLPKIMGYISYDRGFKSGGFNDVLIPTSRYAPETLDAYEVGIKSDLGDRRVRFNAAAFYYDYANLQAVRYPDGLEEVFNARTAKLYGMDWDAEFAVTRRLHVLAGLEALHTGFTEFPDASRSTPAVGGGTNYTVFNADGKHLPLAPNLMADASIEYSVATSFGTARWRVSYAYNSGWYAEPDNRLSQGPYSLVNAQVSLVSHDARWVLSLWGNNLTNTTYETQLSSQQNGDFAIFAPPRTYGVTIQRRL